MPMARITERLLQEDPRAWEMTLLAQRKWFTHPPKKGTSQKIYFDVDDGDLFDEHPELGAAQRGKAADGKIRFCIIMYYDGLEVGPTHTHTTPHHTTHTNTHTHTQTPPHSIQTERLRHGMGLDPLPTVRS